MRNKVFITENNSIEYNSTNIDESLAKTYIFSRNPKLSNENEAIPISLCSKNEDISLKQKREKCKIKPIQKNISFDCNNKINNIPQKYPQLFSNFLSGTINLNRKIEANTENIDISCIPNKILLGSLRCPSAVSSSEKTDMSLLETTRFQSNLNNGTNSECASLNNNKNRRILIFYHIYCSPHISRINIMKEQLNKIIFSGLYAYVDNIYCFLVGKTNSYFEMYKNVLKNIGEKIIIISPKDTSINYEKYTLTKMREYIVSSDIFLYIHTKGVSYQQDTQLYYNIDDWRTVMEYNLIYKFRECISKIQDKEIDSFVNEDSQFYSKYDTVGVNYREASSSYPEHYSGNFWWSTGEHYLSLSPEIGNNYHDPEFYLFTKSHKYFTMYNSNVDHYHCNYPIKTYIEDS